MIQLVPTGPFVSTPQVGTKGRGKTYERKVGKVLAKQAELLDWELLDHWWLCNPVGSGSVWSQPDFVLISPSDCAIVFESKLTWVDCTFQLQKYTSLLTQLGYSSFGICVCRNLTPLSPTPISTFDDIYPGATWHLFL